MQIFSLLLIKFTRFFTNAHLVYQIKTFYKLIITLFNKYTVDKKRIGIGQFGEIYPCSIDPDEGKRILEIRV